MTAIRVEGLGKRYRVGTRVEHETLAGMALAAVTAPLRNARALRRLTRFQETDEDAVWALRDVSFELEEGEVLGVVGRNGAGKSTLLKILSRTVEPTEGRAVLRGRTASLLEVGTGFHNDLTGRENVFLNGSILGMRRREILDRFDEIVEFANIERYIDTPVKRYSSGMYLRLAFAVAAHLDPEILIADEVLAVGDAEFQRKCLAKMRDVASSGRTVVFVSHNKSAVANLCTRAIWLDAGHVRADGAVDEILAHYVRSFDVGSDVSVADRPDRQGDGRAKIVSVVFRDSDGTPVSSFVSGAPATIEIRYETSSTEPLRNAHAGIILEAATGDRIGMLSSLFSDGPVTSLPDKGSFTCSIPHLPLHTGDYVCSVLLVADGQKADFVRDAAAFSVLAVDFYGTGRQPETSWGPILLDYTWQADDERAPG